MWQKKKRVYLDEAAAAVVSVRALKAFTSASLHSGNPASPHAEGRVASAVLEDARARIAVLAEVKADAVIFTGNATEANALALLGHVEALATNGRAYTDMHVLYAPGAHSSVVGNVDILSARGVQTTALPFIHDAASLQALESLITKETVLVSVSAVCGETGASTPVRDMRRVIDRAQKKFGTNITLHMDGSQLPRAGAFQLTRLGADLLTLDAQKVGGVRGIGALIAPRRVPLLPLMQGGGQERGMRPGTPSPALAASFAEALEETEEIRAAFLARAQTLRTQFLADIASLENVVINEGKEQAPYMVNLSLLGRDTDYLVALLDQAGFAVSTKSACEVDAVGSRAVLAMTNDPKRAEHTLRMSWGPTTTARDIRAFSRALLRAVKFLDTAGIL